MRGVGDLGHDVPVGVETIAGAQIFVEVDATAEFRAVTIALEIAGMNDAAEAGFGKKSFSFKSTVQVKPVKNWLASPDVPIEVPRCTRGAIPKKRNGIFPKSTSFAVL
jgi:hypothetical protein